MNFETLKNSINEYLAKQDNSITDTVRGQLINMAQRRVLRNYDLRFGEYTYSLSASASVESYAVPTGYSRTYSVWRMDGSVKKDLTPLTKEEFDNRYGDNSTTGAPLYYTIWENKIYLGPKPDGSYSLEWNIYRMLDDLVDGSPNNENALTTYAWEYLLFRSLHFATIFLIEDARAPIWQAEADKLEADLVREHSREKTVHRRPFTNEPG